MEYRLLKHPQLKLLASNIESGESSISWIVLYSTQALLDQLDNADSKILELLVDLSLSLHGVLRKGSLSLSLDEYWSMRSVALVEKGFTDPQHLIDAVAGSGIVYESRESACNESDDESYHSCPIVLEGEQLYFRQYWSQRAKVREWFELRLDSSFLSDLSRNELSVLKQLLGHIFNPEASQSGREIDWQALAVSHALVHPITLIAGGPGTGKTTTAVRLLTLVVCKRAIQGLAPPVIKLLAPTGKAAVRLYDSIRSQLNDIEQSVTNYISTNDLRNKMGERLSPPNLLECLPNHSETVHRFLLEHNALPGYENTYQGNSLASMLVAGKDRKAEADLILIDESSMIDANLMSSLCSVIANSSQVVLMGDPNQLPPVDPGGVFSEYVARFQSEPYTESQLSLLSDLGGFSFEGEDCLTSNSGLNNPLVTLRKTYRFKGDLKEASHLINQTDIAAFSQRFGGQVPSMFKLHAEGTLDLSSNAASVAWLDTFEFSHIRDYLVDSYQAYIDCIQGRPQVCELEREFSRFQCLCSTYEGELGVRSLNRVIEASMLSASAALTSNNYSQISVYGGVQQDRFLYHGKPILITKNQMSLGISNGDIGFVILEDNAHFVGFPQGEKEPLYVSIKRIEEWQPAYAMTIHKSQGSEYERVGLVLADYAKEVLSKQLLYTGLTRAKLSCEIWASQDSMRKAFCIS